jgi:hypothetical protein
MYPWWISLIAFALGAGVMLLVITIRFIGSSGKNADGELQVYKTEDGLYPVLALNSESSMLSKLRLTLEVRVIESADKKSRK